MQSKRYSEAEETIKRAEQKQFEGDEAADRLKFQLAAIYERQKNYDRAESVFMGILEWKRILYQNLAPRSQA